MATQPRPEERFAYETIRRAVDAVVEHFDDGSAPRQVDGLLTLPDGTRGAIEVTTVAELPALETESLATKATWAVDGARWAWTVRVPGGTSIRDVRLHLPAVVVACEAAGVREPAALVDLPDEAARHGVSWLLDAGASLYGHPETTRPGAIDVLPLGGGGAVDEHLHELAHWLRAAFETEAVARSIAKLSATGLPERHLFVRVHDSAMPDGLYMGVALYEGVPAETLDAPGGLTGLWLAAQWKNPILAWRKKIGWRRYDVHD